jgi:WD40 repeat protein
VAFSPEGRLLAVGEADGVVQLWNPATGAQVATLPGRFTLVWSLAFSPDGRLLAAGVQDGTDSATATGTTRVWDVASGALVATLPQDSDPAAVLSVAFSPDGRLLASGGDNGEITLWNTVTRTMLASLTGSGVVSAVVFSPNGLDIVATGSDKQLRFWDVASHDLLNFIAGPYTTPVAASLAFTPDGHTLVLGNAAGAFMLRFDPATLSTAEPLTGVAFSRDGHLIATTAGSGPSRLWDAATGWPVRVLTANSAGARSVAFSRDGDLLASAGGDGYVRLWEPATGAQLTALRLLGPAGLKVVFSPDGSLLAAGSGHLDTRIQAITGSGGIQVWDTHTRKLLAAIPAAPPDAGPVFSPDGSLLAYGIDPYSSSQADQVRLVSARSLRPVAALPPVAGQMLDLAFSPDGHTVAASFEDGTVRTWDIRTRRLLSTIQPTTAQARDIAFSPDGRTLAVGGSDDLVRLVDVRTGAVTAVLEGQANQINDVAFSPSGQTLASASGDGSAILWNLDPGQAVQQVCQDLRGPLLAGQWENLHPGIGIGPPPC